MRPLLAWFVITIALVGCGGGNGESCRTFASACPRGGTLQACCTATDCRYLASDGTVFGCQHTDCSAAKMQANAWCQSH